MTGTSAFIYSDDYLRYQFGANHPFKPIRCTQVLHQLEQMKVFNHTAKVVNPKPATDEVLQLVHEAQYIEFVKQMCARGMGYLDLGDTPATRGLFEAARSVVGGSITGAELLEDRAFTHAFNLGGGLHHAKPDSASGFCVFNDIAIAVRWLQMKGGYERVAIVDIDGHHGDGTQEIFYTEPILKISTHRIGIFPGTGYVDEIGEGKGMGYTVNIPLPGGVEDDHYLYAYNEIILPLLEWYRPEIIFVQFGADGHIGDPLVGLSLTTRTYEAVADSLHLLAHRFCEGKLLIFGGGGYDLDSTVRCWTLMFIVISQTLSRNSLEYLQLLDPPRECRDAKAEAKVRELVAAIRRSVFKIHGIR